VTTPQEVPSTSSEASTGSPPRADQIPAVPRAVRWTPAHVAATVIVIASVATMTGPLRDIDTYWHLLIGREILDNGRIGGLGTSWSAYAPGADWLTSQWLSEVVMTWIHDLFGWRGLIAARMALGLVVMVGLARLLFRYARPWPAVAVLGGLTITIVPAIQERPSLATLALAIWLSGASAGLLLRDERSRWWLVLGITAVWANLHGGWVLVPLAFAAVAAASSLDATTRNRIKPALGLAAVALVGACLTPVGVRTLVMPLSFVGRTEHIVEWQRTSLLSPWSLGLTLGIGLLAVAWARRSRPTAWPEIALCIAWAGFGLLAFRNVAPAALMLAPYLAVAADGLAPHRTPRRLIEASLILVATIAAVVSGVMLTVLQISQTQPLSETEPRLIAERLNAQADPNQPVTVLNDYNSSGVLAYFGGPGVRLVVDGRADRFPADWVKRIGNLQDGVGIDEGLKEIAPQAVVTEKNSVLSQTLVQDKQWVIELEDGRYVLLLPPPV